MNLPKKLDVFEYDQKNGIKDGEYGHIWGSLFPVSWNETEKKVTSSDSQNYHIPNGFQKIRPILILKTKNETGVKHPPPQKNQNLNFWYQSSPPINNYTFWINKTKMLNNFPPVTLENSETPWGVVTLNLFLYLHEILCPVLCKKWGFRCKPPLFFLFYVFKFHLKLAKNVWSFFQNFAIKK